MGESGTGRGGIDREGEGGKEEIISLTSLAEPAPREKSYLRFFARGWLRQTTP